MVAMNLDKKCGVSRKAFNGSISGSPKPPSPTPGEGGFSGASQVPRDG